jgi:hypothetical protein
MKKEYLIGGAIGGILVWLFLRKKCKPCEGGGGKNNGSLIIPSVFVQNPVVKEIPQKDILLPPAPTPIISPVLPPPPPPPSGGGKTNEPLKFTGSDFYKSWGSWVK